MDNEGWTVVGRRDRDRDRAKQVQKHEQKIELNRENEYVVILNCETETKLSSKNTMSITKEIRKNIGDIVSMKFLTGGNLLLKLKNNEQKDKAMLLKTICSVPIRPTLPRYQTENKGVIFGVPLEISTHDIQLELKELYTMQKVERLFNKKTNQYTSTVILDFGTTPTPDEITLFFQTHIVHPYIRQPTRCYKCQKFGHGANDCRASHSKCPHCAEENHKYENCPNKKSKPVCVNCGEGHSAAYRGCRAYVEAKDIEKVRTQLKCTYSQAVKAYKQSKNTNENDNKIPQNNIEKPYTSSQPSSQPTSQPTQNAWRKIPSYQQQGSQNTTETTPRTNFTPSPQHTPTTEPDISITAHKHETDNIANEIAGLIGFVIHELIKGKLKTANDIAGCVAIGAKYTFRENITSNTILESIEHIKKSFIQQTTSENNEPIHKPTQNSMTTESASKQETLSEQTPTASKHNPTDKIPTDKTPTKTDNKRKHKRRLSDQHDPNEKIETTPAKRVNKDQHTQNINNKE